MAMKWERSGRGVPSRHEITPCEDLVHPALVGGGAQALGRLQDPGSTSDRVAEADRVDVDPVHVADQGATGPGPAASAVSTATKACAAGVRLRPGAA